MKKVGLSVLVVCILLVASFAYADPIAGKWASMSPCINDLQVSNNHTFYLWQGCCEDGCCDVNEFSGTWQRISNGVYILTAGNSSSLLMLRGTTAVGEYGLTMLKNMSIDSLKPLIYQSVCY